MMFLCLENKTSSINNLHCVSKSFNRRMFCFVKLRKYFKTVFDFKAQLIIVGDSDHVLLSRCAHLYAPGVIIHSPPTEGTGMS